MITVSIDPVNNDLHRVKRKRPILWKKTLLVVGGFDEADPQRGRVNYRGADWNARSPKGQLAPGAVAKIVGRDGNTLIIEQENG